MKHQRGFTLIEVMVAIMLMAIVSLIAWRGLDSITRTDAHLKNSSEDHASLMRALEQLNRDIDLRTTVELDPPALPNTPLLPRAPAVALSNQNSSEPWIELVRSAPEHKGELVQIRWWLQAGTLYRASSSARSRLPLARPKEGVAVLSGVHSLQLRIWEPGKGWRTLDQGKAQNPVGIEVTLSRQTDQGTEGYRQVFGPLN